MDADERRSCYEELGVVVEGQPIYLLDCNLWDYEWESINGSAVDLPHPSYRHQRHRFSLYKLKDGPPRFDSWLACGGSTFPGKYALGWITAPQ